MKTNITFTVSQYANRTGHTRQSVHKQIKENRLPKGVTAKKIGSTWLISINK